MLSRKLLGSGSVQQLERHLLYVWGTNESPPLIQSYEVGTPFGFPDSYLNYEPHPGNVVPESTSPILVSNYRIFNSLPKNLGVGGAVLDAGKQLHLIGDAKRYSSNSNDERTYTSAMLDRQEQIRINKIWPKISSGDGHTLFLDDEGRMYAAGNNNSGQLGDGTTNSRSSKVQIGTTQSWAQISAGRSYSLAITTDGKLYGWGSTLFGVLGLGENTPPSILSPVQIGTSSWTQVSASTSHSAAIRIDGRLFTWGFNDFGQLGDGTRDPKFSPVSVTPADSWTQVSVGYSNTLAIRADGKLFAWGSDWLTNGAGHRSEPVQISITVGGVPRSWTQVSVGDIKTLAITTLGELYAWGSGSGGALGLGDILARTAPNRVGTGSWTQVSIFNQHAVGRTLGDDIFAWGTNATGQLGQGNTFSRSSPVFISTNNVSTDKSPIWVNAGQATTFFAFANFPTRSNLWSFGRNTNGELGIGDTFKNRGVSPIYSGFATAPQEQLTQSVVGPAIRRYENDRWNKISLDGETGVGIKSDGSLWTWEVNQQPVIRGAGFKFIDADRTRDTVYAIREDGMLFGLYSAQGGAFGGFTDSYLSDLTQISTESWTQISVKTRSGGFPRVAAIRPNQSLWGWGDNSVFPFYTPGTSPNPANISRWTQVSMGRSHAAAIASNGKLFTWGYNSNGQLGVGTSSLPIVSPVQVGVLSWTQVSAQALHTAAIRVDGKLFTWGNNLSGQLGHNNTISRSSPVQVGTSSWTQVSVGENTSTAAITADGTLFTWGSGSFGQTGLVTVTNVSSPIQVGSLSSWTQVSMGTGTTGAIRDGKLFMWGLSTQGTVGDGQKINRSSPVQIGTSNWTSVSVGSLSAAAIREDGSLFTWGVNTNGQLGHNNVVSLSSPVQVGTSSWTQVSCGINHMTAIRADGLLFSWGRTQFYQGFGVSENRSSPVQVGTFSWTQVSNALDTYSGITTTNELYLWGDSFHNTLIGQFGNTNSTPRKISDIVFTPITLSTPQVIPIGVQQIRNVVMGENSVSAIARDSLTTAGNPASLYTWGDNTWGQLGLGDTSYRSFPTKVGTLSYAAVGVGDRHMAAVTTDGRLYAWGNNEFKQIGREHIVTPEQVYSWKQITTRRNLGRTYVLAVRSDGALRGWGSNIITGAEAGEIIKGAISNGSDDFYNTPQTILSGSYTQVSIGGDAHFAALRTDGRLFTWGRNNYGQCGHSYDIFNGFGIAAGKSTPGGLTSVSVTMVSLGERHSTAITSLGQLYTWGDNSNGQLGNPTQVGPPISPIQIGTSSWTQVAAGGFYVAAIRLGGSLFTWGDNADGQLGSGTILSRSSPVQVGTSSWTQVKSGGYYTGGITSIGRLFMWGWNTVGQVGDNSTLSRSAPVQIGTSSWTQLALEVNNTTYAIRLGGSLFSWGLNDAGNLGNGTFGSSTRLSSPVQVGTRSWTNVDTRFAERVESTGTNLWYGVSALLGDGQPSGSDVAVRARYYEPVREPSTISFANTSSPVLVTNSLSDRSWVQVTAGPKFTYALKK
jgi:alpha-tubulin suppressor-like RCC1 family protein